MAIETRMTSAAEVLFEARRRAGMTQIELADRGCVAPSVISQVERGRRNPSLATLQRLVAGTGYTVGLTLYRPDPGTYCSATPEWTDRTRRPTNGTPRVDGSGPSAGGEQQVGQGVDVR